VPPKWLVVSVAVWVVLAAALYVAIKLML